MEGRPKSNPNETVNKDKNQNDILYNSSKEIQTNKEKHANIHTNNKQTDEQTKQNKATTKSKPKTKTKPNTNKQASKQTNKQTINQQRTSKQTSSIQIYTYPPFFLKNICSFSHTPCFVFVFKGPAERGPPQTASGAERGEMLVPRRARLRRLGLFP